jgi:glycosyltransferase involved in cell wall biosynthesis
MISGVKVIRIPEITIFEKVREKKAGFLRRLSERVKSIVGYALEYLYFTCVTFITSLYILVTRGFDVVHMHNPPDTLAVIGIFYKLLGKKYVFDHHDLSPELYLTRVSGEKDIIFRSLILFEKISCKFSDVIISTNESYRSIAVNRHSADVNKIFVVRNNPILSNHNRVLESIDRDRKGGKKTLLFLGSINPQDGIDVLLKVLHYLVFKLKKTDILCDIVGGGDSLETARAVSRELGLADFVSFTGMIFDKDKVREYLYSTDIGVEPAPLNDANKHSTFIKVMEYMEAGKPVVAFDLKESRYSADGAAILVPPGDIDGFAHAIEKLLDDPNLRTAMGSRGRQRIQEQLNWDVSKNNLIEAYRYLGQY